MTNTPAKLTFTLPVSHVAYTGYTKDHAATVDKIRREVADLAIGAAVSGHAGPKNYLNLYNSAAVSALLDTYFSQNIENKSGVKKNHLKEFRSYFTGENYQKVPPLDKAALEKIDPAAATLATSVEGDLKALFVAAFNFIPERDQARDLARAKQQAQTVAPQASSPPATPIVNLGGASSPVR